MADFNDIIARASALMNDEHFNNLVESKAGAFSGKKTVGKSNFTDLEAQAFGAPIQTKKTITENTQVASINNNNKSAASVLPNVIRESFEKMPPVTGTHPSLNMLGGMPTTFNTNQSVGIDYSLIKSLIDESISRHLGEIKQQIINESTNTLKGVRLGEGNKIALVDKRGNIYEGTLKIRQK